jgi:protein Mpv17
MVPTMIQDDDSDGDTKKKEFHYDIPRTARAVTFGFAIHAPLSHVHYNLLEWMTVKGGFTGLSIPIFKTVMEQFVYWSWFSNSLYHGAMGAMQGKNMDEIQNRIKDVLWDTQVAQWKFWIPVQLLNFQFVPVRHQLNVVLLTR